MFDELINQTLYFLVKDETLESVILYNRGTIRYRMGCHDDALKDLELAVKKQPNNEEFKEAALKCKEAKQ